MKKNMFNPLSLTSTLTETSRISGRLAFILTFCLAVAVSGMTSAGGAYAQAEDGVEPGDDGVEVDPELERQRKLLEKMKRAEKRNEKIAEDIPDNLDDSEWEDILEQGTPYVEISIKGNIWPPLSYYVEHILNEAYDAGVEHIVLRINSSDGIVFEGEELADVIDDWGDDFTFHAFVERAIGPSLWAVFSCDNIFIEDGASIGGADTFRQDFSELQNEQVEAKMISIISGYLSGIAESNDHNSKIAHAMVRADDELWYGDADGDGEYEYYLTEPEQAEENSQNQNDGNANAPVDFDEFGNPIEAQPGDGDASDPVFVEYTQLVDREEVLVLNSDELIKHGVAIARFDDSQDIGDSMGYDDWTQLEIDPDGAEFYLDTQNVVRLLEEAMDSFDFDMAELRTIEDPLQRRRAQRFFQQLDRIITRLQNDLATMDEYLEVALENDPRLTLRYRKDEGRRDEVTWIIEDIEDWQYGSAEALAALRKIGVNTKRSIRSFQQLGGDLFDEAVQQNILSILNDFERSFRKIEDDIVEIAEEGYGNR